MRRRLLVCLLAIISGVLSIMPVIAQNPLNLRGRPASEWFGDPKLADLANAAAANNLPLIDRLVKEGVPVDGLSKVGQVTPLVFALAMNSYAGSQRLLELGANPNRRVVIDRTDGLLISMITMSADLNLIELLLRFKCDPNVVSNARTPLMRAAAHKPSVELLMRYGADINYDDGFGRTAASVAAAIGALDVVKLFLDSGLTAELDRLALSLQSRVYSPEFEAPRQALLEILKAKGVKIRYSKNNPNTPQVTHPEYSREESEADTAAFAARRKARGLP
jgi:ankyrin repeat protein